MTAVTMEMTRTLCFVLFFMLDFTLSFFLGGSNYIEPKPHFETVDGEKTIDIRMPGAKPLVEDYYVCTSIDVSKEDLYVTQFEAEAEANTAHHMILFGCASPGGDEKMWKCGTPCANSVILFAWARNAEPTRVPKDVGFHIGSSSKARHLVLQVHYARVFSKTEPPDHSGVRLYVTDKRPHYLAGVLLMGLSWFTIPGQTKVVHGDISCPFPGSTAIYPFAFRTHAHTLGVVITGYQFNASGWHLIGKGDPQLPQAFYPVQGSYRILPGDYLAARCTYNSIGRNRDTKMGATHNDEMCNFYVMYYTDADKGKTFYDCWGDRLKGSYKFPAGSDTPLPPNPLLKHHHHHHGGGGGDHDGGGVDAHNVGHVTGGKVKTDDSSLLDMTAVKNWPKLPQGLKLGQVAGIDTDSSGLVYLFHRGPTVWDGSSFDMRNKYLKIKDGPIKQKTLVSVDSEGHLVEKGGANMFYMPHGLTIDCDDNLWVTDVAMHQVFRFPKGSGKPDLTLGEKFVPGNDEHHFCKPTDVAVLKNGDFFVSDGYCNTRVMKFSKNGTVITQWGFNKNNQEEKDGFPPAGSFNLPHGLALDEAGDTVCLADRENARIQCFDLKGKFKYQLHRPEFGDSVYAIAHSNSFGGVLHVVTGPNKPRGFCLAMNSTGEILSTFEPKEKFHRPHDVAVDKLGRNVYVAEIGPNKVWRFKTVKDDITIVATKKEELDGKPGISMDAEDSPDNGDEIVDQGGIPAYIIGCALIVPVVLIVVVLVILRLKRAGKFNVWTVNKYDERRGFSIGKLFNRHHGFDPLNTEELEHLTDSDGEEIEEFSSQRKL